VPFQSKTNPETPVGEEIPAETGLLEFRCPSSQTCAETAGRGVPWLAVSPKSPPRWLFGECKFKSQRVVERHWTTIQAICSPNGSPVMEECNLPGSMPNADIWLGIGCRPLSCICPPPIALSAGQNAQMDPRIYLGSHGIGSATCQPES
jgi:hypothetical protein